MDEDSRNAALATDEFDTFVLKCGGDSVERQPAWCAGAVSTADEFPAGVAEQNQASFEAGG
jgi:hypothetical protein